jgi:hypothetical protein
MGVRKLTDCVFLLRIFCPAVVYLRITVTCGLATCSAKEGISQRLIKMKKSIITYALVLLVYFGLTSSAWATPVDVNKEALMVLEHDTSITCIAYFIPGVPGVPSSLIFTQAPQWTDTYYFDYVSEGWDTVLTDGGKTAYLFGPEITNSRPDPCNLFSYKLYFHWDTEDVVDYPVYLDTVVFDYEAIISKNARWGTPDSFESVPGTTWQEEYGGLPYDNPVPEPMTICFLGFGAAFCRKTSSRKGWLTPLTGVRKRLNLTARHADYSLKRL